MALIALAGVVPAAAAPLAGLSDDFDSPALAGWSSLTSAADRVSVTGGTLTISSAQASWVRAERAFYLWKLVTGDFVATARLQAHGASSAIPSADWSLAGLLVRDATVTARRGENWIGWTTGGVAGQQVFERKTTRGSVSILNLIPARTGWLQVRVARVGPQFLLLHRYDGGAWTLDWTYWRDDLPRTLQVGVDAQSGWHDTHADLVADVDFVHFAETGIPAKLRARFAAGRAKPAQVLRYLTRE